MAFGGLIEVLNSGTAIVLSVLVFGATFFMGFAGVGSDKIPDDVSVRVESERGGQRVHRGGGIRYGK